MPEIQNYIGSCHCRSTRFRFATPEIQDAMSCNCSICSRRGALLSNFILPPAQLSIETTAHPLSVYQFGTMVAKHHFCSNCGILTFVETRLNPGNFRINLGCVEGLDVFDLAIVQFDGNTI